MLDSGEGRANVLRGGSKPFEPVDSNSRVDTRALRRRGDPARGSAAVAHVNDHLTADAGSRGADVDPVADVWTREQTYRRYLAAADGLASLFSVLFAAMITGTHLTWLVAATPVLVVLAAKLLGLYDRDDLVIGKSTWREFPRLVNLTAVATVIAYAARSPLIGGHGAREGFFLVLWPCALLTIVAGRTLARRAPDERCVIVGNEAHCAGLGARLAQIDGVTVAGTVPLAELAGSPGALHALTRRLSAHRLIVATDRQLSEGETLDVIRLAKAIGLRVSLFPSVMAAVGGSVVFDRLGGFTLLGVPRFGLSRSSAAIKRAFDVMGALVAMLVFAPVMVIVAVLIKLDSRGPVLFRQTRVGRDGNLFEMRKFRSMIDGADALKRGLLADNEAGDGLFKIAADPRVTRVGRRLRRTRIDELPQLFNVLAGQMSLVGPRPLIVEEDERIVGLDRRRLHLTPGMTGPWQILGSSTVPIKEMAKLDYLYIANWSLWEDLRILIQTLFLVVQRRGV